MTAVAENTPHAPFTIQNARKTLVAWNVGIVQNKRLAVVAVVRWVVMIIVALLLSRCFEGEMPRC